MKKLLLALPILLLLFSCAGALQTPVLDLYMTYTAVADDVNGDFQIYYTITNYGNVPIYITNSSYVIRASNYTAIAYDDVGITFDSLVFDTYLDVNASISETLAGYSMYLIPYYFDLSIYYDDGFGNSSSEMILDGAFVFQ